MISYPLREYISSKKNDDYCRSVANIQSDCYSTKKNCPRCFSFLILFVIVSIVSIFYVSYCPIDPTCFQSECSQFVCQAYEKGLIGGHLCPDLCTTKSVQLQNCLGEHKHFRSRLFANNEESEVIRCYFQYPFSKSNPSIDVRDHFNYPAEDSTLETFSSQVEQQIRKIIPLNDLQLFLEKLMKFADFNQDEKISLSEARSLWSLVQIDEFLYNLLLSDKSYTPKMFGTCGHLFSLEKVISSKLLLNAEQELSPIPSRPNWYQRVRLAIGIIEFVLDTNYYEDTLEHLFLCQPLIKSFGYDKDYEAKVLKLNHLKSSRSLLSNVPITCRSSEDCSSNVDCPLICNKTTNRCEIGQFRFESLKNLCSFLRNVLVPDANATFIDNFQNVLEQCQQIIIDANHFNEKSFDFISLEIRQTIVLQNLKNLLWTNIEYEMGKITKKSTKQTALPPQPANFVK